MMQSIHGPDRAGAVRAHFARELVDQSAVAACDWAHPLFVGLADDFSRVDDWVSSSGAFAKGLAHDEWGRVRRADLEAFLTKLMEDDVPLSRDRASGREAGTPQAPKRLGQAKRGHRIGETADRHFGFAPNGLNFARSPAMSSRAGLELGSSDLTRDLGELYAMALLRDIPFGAWATEDCIVPLVLGALNRLPPPVTASALNAGAPERSRAKPADEGLSAATLLREFTAGAMTGPLVSQFLLIDNPRVDLPEAPASVVHRMSPVADRRLFCPTGDTNRCGFRGIPSKFVPLKPGCDYMMSWESWLSVQNGANRSGISQFHFEAGQPVRRFATTPRDLLTTVYTNDPWHILVHAGLKLLELGAPLDRGLPKVHVPDGDAPAIGGGSPAIPTFPLSFFREASRRAMAAIRRPLSLCAQPEAVAAGITLSWSAEVDSRLQGRLGDLAPAMDRMRRDLAATGLLDLVAWRNGASLTAGIINAPDRNALLPMAFPGGAPADRFDGVGRAAVAGTCATLLKALFEMYEMNGTAMPLMGIKPRARTSHPDHVVIDMQPEFPASLFARPITIASLGQGPLSVQEPEPWGALLRTRDPVLGAPALTLQGEIDKLAANVALGPCLAGCSFPSDQLAALRLGERLAVGLLQEKMLAWRGPASLRFHSFDGDSIMLVRADSPMSKGETQVQVWDECGEGGTTAAFEAWWWRG